MICLLGAFVVLPVRWRFGWSLTHGRTSMLGNCKCHVCGDTIPLNQPVYCYDDRDGVEQNYHMICFVEQTTQGVQGYQPTKVYGALARQNDDLDSEGAHSF